MAFCDIDDPGRLATLRQYNILDTPREAPFDFIADMAAEICQTPIAAINFIDRDRQWAKAAIGLDPRQVPLDRSICVHALQAGDPFVVPNLLLDPRFAGNPLVTDGPRLRFYAGAPLRTAAGVGLGTLCVFDRRPRELSERQLKVLKMLADQAMVSLELRRIHLASERARVRSESTEMDLQAALEARDAAIASKNALLREKDDLLRQKDNLLREVNHRIKNSLQLVSSLLALQSRSAGNAEVRAQLAAASLRVSAIGRAHQRLYQTNELAAIDLGGYLRRLCEDIAESLTTDGEKPTLIVEAAEVSLPTDHAISVGLIVSELITNAVKHAYDGRVGTIGVRLQAVDEDRLVLSVADDGKGLPDEFNPSGGAGLGMKILAALIKSLHAELACGRPPRGRGACFSLAFSRTRLAASPADQPS